MTQHSNKPLALPNGSPSGNKTLHRSPARTCKSYVPSRARTRLGLWRAVFLRALAKSPSVTAACRAAGVPRMTAYDHRERDPEFAAKWDSALNESLDTLEAALYQRALKDDTYAGIALLKAHRPSLYRENMKVDMALLGGLILIPAKQEGAE
jgi:hypothetical protein